MKVGLHINSYYFTNRIHFYFRKILTCKEDKIYYFVPTYKGASKVFEDKEIVNYEIYNKLDKIFFFTKIAKAIFKSRALYNREQYSYIHAHTLISDGLVGLGLSILHKRPLIVTVRNTDVNYFLPNAFFRFLGRIVIRRAKLIIFLSPSYEKKIESIYPFTQKKKKLILPSGLDPFWLENLHRRRISLNIKKKTKLLLVGRVDKNKNIQILLDLLTNYSDRNYELNIVGDNLINIDFEEFNKTLPHGNKVFYWGKIRDKRKLLEVYRGCDIFVLLSHAESFGVVYIEALSQALPIIYTENEGVDGYFKSGHVGYASSPKSVELLKNKIDNIIDNYSSFVSNTTITASEFSWGRIANKYQSVIKDIIT